MFEVIGSAACVALVTALAYVERTKLKADVKAAEAKVLAVATKLVAELQLKEKESAVRVKVSADVAKVIAAAKADAEKVDRNPVLTSALALVEKIEADLKKIL
jgi:hypothetical protein